MTDLEIAAFLARHPAVAARVLAFAEVVATVGYDQVPVFPGGWEFWTYDILDYWLNKLPSSIPASGMAVWDETLHGWVILFPDANGTVRFTLSNNAGAALQINKPAYESPTPPGTSPLEQLGWLLLVVAAAVVYSAWKR